MVMVHSVKSSTPPLRTGIFFNRPSELWDMVIAFLGQDVDLYCTIFRFGGRQGAGEEERKQECPDKKGV